MSVGQGTAISTLWQWLATSALPFWRQEGFDTNLGLFRERLTVTGAPMTVPARAMVQARQIYVFAHAALLGDTVGLEQAMRASGELISRFGQTRGDETSFAFSIDPTSGVPVSEIRDSYTHAFVLLAIAFLYRATGDVALVDLADQVTRFVERRFVDASAGGVVDAVPSPPNSAKRQNPQMHLLEAYLALDEAMPGRGHLRRALDLVALFRTTLLDREFGVLLEHFDAAWGAHPDPQRADVFEPGHHYEWVWLLEQAERLSGIDLANERNILWASARRHGHADSGLIIDEVSKTGAVVAPSCRLWPHTEGIKAAATMSRTGDVEAKMFGDAMAAELLQVFVGKPFASGWIDHVEADLRPRVDYVPASSLYHLFLGAAEGVAAFGIGREHATPMTHNIPVEADNQPLR